LLRLASQAIDLDLQVQGAGVIQRLKSGVKLLVRDLRRGFDGGCLLGSLSHKATPRSCDQ